LKKKLEYDFGREIRQMILDDCPKEWWIKIPCPKCKEGILVKRRVVHKDCPHAKTFVPHIDEDKQCLKCNLYHHRTLLITIKEVKR